MMKRVSKIALVLVDSVSEDDTRLDVSWSTYPMEVTAG
jgi:hypothetical protein